MYSETTKHFGYKCHGLLVNSPVMITAKSFFKMSFNAIKYYVLYKTLSRIMANYSHVIYACYQNMLRHLFTSC